MKRWMSLLLVLVFCLSLCACGSTAAPTEPPTEPPTEAPTAAPTEPPEPTISPEELARQAAYHEKMAAVFAEKLEGVIPGEERIQIAKNIKVVEVVKKAEKPLEYGERVFTDTHIDPEWVAEEPEDVRILVECSYGVSEKGVYIITNGKAYQRFVSVQISDLANGNIYGKNVFHGSEPPKTVNEPGDHYGSAVDEAEIRAWINAVIEEKAPQMAKRAIEEVEYNATKWGYSPKSIFDWLNDDFSDAMIEYALEHCNVDWRKNAQMEVENPPYTTQSYKEMVNWLVEYAGYTEEDAIYAADNCGADWKERCCRLVKLYLEDDATYNDKREWMISYLKEYKLFTDEEVEYALDKCGVK